MGNENTITVSTESIMRSAAFHEGFVDGRDIWGLEKFPTSYETMTRKEQWDYERGRQFAIVAPEILKIKHGKKVKKEAISAYQSARRKKWIL